MIDTHCHLDYLGDPGAELGELGLSGAVCIGASAGHARAAVALAEQWPWVWATVGLHPTDVTGEDGQSGDTGETRALVEALSLHPRVVGIGESGLDHYWAQDDQPQQREALSWQMDLARRRGLPLVLHTRDRDGEEVAHRGVMDALREEGAGVTAILHCFSGHRGLLELGLQRGDYVSFAGNLTYKNAQAIQAAALDVPINRLLVETDAPFLAPVPKRGRSNRPHYIRHTLRFLAGLRGVDEAELEAALDDNARRVYSRMEPPTP